MASQSPKRSKKTKKVEDYVLDSKKACANRFSDESPCCSQQCWKHISNETLDRHLADLAYFRGEGFRTWWSWVRTLYFVATPITTDKSGKTQVGGRVRYFRVPAVPRNLCKPMFCALLGVTTKTVDAHIKCNEAQQAITPKHGNTARVPSNALKPIQVENVVKWVLQVAAEDGVKKPRRVVDRNAQPPGSTITVTQLILPARYTMNNLFARYAREMAEQEHVGRTSFYNIFDKDTRLAHVKLASILTKRGRPPV